jgi:tartrate-resistant acid phosphatase type 5
MPEFHAEPYLYLADVTHKSALITWGSFYFRIQGRAEDGAWKLVQDRDLRTVYPPRYETMGARSEPYGSAVVEVFDEAGHLVAGAKTQTTNHVWVSGLRPNQSYRYRVVVNGEEWAAGERRDWTISEGGQGLRTSGRTYDNRFRTHPHPEDSVPFTFAVLGDFGTGVSKPSTPKRRQREVAAALEAAFQEQDIRFLLTTGDNIYAARTFLGIPFGETGDEDDDWFFTYYQPYRYLINRIPVYPCVGNHDTGETERSDDRAQLEDNFFLRERFGLAEQTGQASLAPGLFYRFSFGADAEFICIDTSKRSPLPGDRMFAHPNHAGFVESAFAPGAPHWRIPFSHHPPYCAGPIHYNSRSLIASLVPRFQQAGVRLMLSGHEHNFQHSQVDGIHYVITGAGGKVRTTRPLRFGAAHTESWAAAGHFLLVDVTRERLVVRPIGELGDSNRPQDLMRSTLDGDVVRGPIIIERGAA